MDSLNAMRQQPTAAIQLEVTIARARRASSIRLFHHAPVNVRSTGKYVLQTCPMTSSHTIFEWTKSMNQTTSDSLKIFPTEIFFDTKIVCEIIWSNTLQNIFTFQAISFQVSIVGRRARLSVRSCTAYKNDSPIIITPCSLLCIYSVVMCWWVIIIWESMKYTTPTSYIFRINFFKLTKPNIRTLCHGRCAQSKDYGPIFNN